jgi:membrane-bound metal-dependent hydrolase YbcI (DUF457 family)
MLFYKLGISNINYYMALPIMLMAAKAGALFPDVDHAWANVKEKTLLNKFINTVIHATGGKHRSWQTHSLDICIVYTLLACVVPHRLYVSGILSIVNKEVLSLLLLGFASGWISHMLADMLTSAGVRLLCFWKFNMKLVPRKLGPIVFNTGHEWEAFNYKVMKICNMFLGIICVIYPLILNGTISKLFEGVF